MRLMWNLTAIAAIALLSGTASGQTLLDRIEGTLKGKSAAAPADSAPAAAPAANKGYLGFTPDEDSTDGKGVWVISTKPGAPADVGGLKKGDLITEVDGRKVTGVTELDPILDKATVGQKLKMTVVRDGKSLTLNLTLGRRPAAPAAAQPAAPSSGAASPLAEPSPAPVIGRPAFGEAPSDPGEAPAAGAPSLEPPAAAPTLEPPSTTEPGPAPAASPIRSRPLTLTPPATEDPSLDPGAPRSVLDPGSPSATEPPADAGTSGRASLGITVVPLTDEAAAEVGVPVRRGALITGVRPGSSADTVGLPIGGVIVAIDGQKIENADQLVAVIRAARAGQEVELTYYDRDQFHRKSVRLASAGSAIVAAPPADSPFSLPPRTDRPLLNRIEGVVDDIAGRRGPSTVYDPSEMAALRDNVLRLEKLVQDLQDRLKLLESKLGDTPPASNPLGGEAPAP